MVIWSMMDLTGFRIKPRSLVSQRHSNRYMAVPLRVFSHANTKIYQCGHQVAAEEAFSGHEQPNSKLWALKVDFVWKTLTPAIIFLLRISQKSRHNFLTFRQKPHPSANFMKMLDLPVTNISQTIQKEA